MLLTYVVILCLVSALLLGVYAAFLKELAPRHVATHIPQPMLVSSGVASTILVVLLCMRSLNFGVDTVAYAELFSHYCSGGSLYDVEGSFQAATLLLNTLMLGACRPSLLPAAWTIAIVLPVLVLPVTWRLKISYLAAFLLSIVGIELATNALRQGLSVGFLLLSVSILTAQTGQRRWLALPFALAALLFHSSAALFLAVYLLALLPWHLFLGTSLTIIFLIVNSLDIDFALPIASNFIYEIQKYAAHDGDEIWIRVLAFATVLASLAAPLLARNNTALRPALSNGPYAIAARLSLLCVPSLVLPYFGYRFIYSVYPIILFLTLSASMLPKISPLGRPYAQLLWLTGMNVMVLFAWAAGSSYMRSVPFL
jgi:hypothetical protein